MIGKEEERDALIDRMLGAATVRDIKEANASADAWPKENPGDERVLAAQERLDEEGARVLDPERSVDRTTLMLYVCAFSATALTVFVLTGRPYASGFAGLLVAFGFPWEGVAEAITEWRRGPGPSGHENGER